MKVVLDTNVLLAAFGTRGLCEAVIAATISAHTIIISEHILDELHRHLTKKFKVPASKAKELIAFLRQSCTIIKPAKISASACRDKNDLPVLGTAVAAHADCIVTGDNDLTVLKKFQEIPILNPRDFYDRLRKDSAF